MFWVISVYFNIRNILPKSGTFPRDTLYIYIYVCVCVCVCIYLFINLLHFKSCIDVRIAFVNYRNVKLFLNKGSCVPTDSKQYVFKHCTNTAGCTAFNFKLCIQCVEYTERNRVYKGMMTTHHKNHLHFLNTSTPRMHTV